MGRSALAFGMHEYARRYRKEYLNASATKRTLHELWDEVGAGGPIARSGRRGCGQGRVPGLPSANAYRRTCAEAAPIGD